MSDERGTLDSLQALRAFAALAVVLDHVDFIGRGAFGVDVFFVISGFIICHVTARDPAHFLQKRLIRIVPLYWVTTLGVFAIALVAPKLLGATTASYAELLQSLFFIPFEKEPGRVVPVLFLGWTLNYEMFFYAVYAVALRTKYAPLSACAILLVLVEFGQLFPSTSVVWRFYTSPNLLEFCYGVGVYLLWRRYGGGRAAVPAAFSAVLASLALVALLAIDYPLGSTWRCAGWGLPAALLVACVLAQQGRLRFPVALVALGDASYSLYLLHPYALKAIEKVIGPMDRLTGATAISCLLYLGAAAAMALCVYQYFERPLLRLMRRRLIGRWHGVRTGRVATATG